MIRQFLRRSASTIAIFIKTSRLAAPNPSADKSNRRNERHGQSMLFLPIVAQSVEGRIDVSVKILAHFFAQKSPAGFGKWKANRAPSRWWKPPRRVAGKFSQYLLRSAYRITSNEGCARETSSISTAAPAAERE
jgi:hypothetical protein